MIDIHNERCHTLGKLALLLPQKRTPRTLKNWCLSGVRTPVGIVKMESIQYGGERISSLEAFERFIAKINGDGIDDEEQASKPVARKSASSGAKAKPAAAAKPRRQK